VAPLVPPLEPDSLAKEVLALLADRKARERLANQVRRRAWARHRWELIAGQTADVYQTWIPATPRAAGRASQRSLMEGGP
jgi:glycosyltransferase involved in cell wall biosynthesis